MLREIKPKSLVKIILSLVIIVSCFAVFFYLGSSPTLAQFGEDRVENINIPKLELIASILRIINIVLGFLALVAVVIVLYAGYLWMTAGGKADQVTKAKKLLINGLIGLVIILLSVAIVMYVFNVLEHKLLGDGGNGGGCDPPCEAGYICRNSQCVIDDGGGLPENMFKVSTVVTSCGNPLRYNADVHLCSSIVIKFNHYLGNEAVSAAVADNSLRIDECADSSCASATPLPQVYVTGKPTGTANEWIVNNSSLSFINKDLYKKNTTYRLVLPKTLKDKSGLVIHPQQGCGSSVIGCQDAGTSYRWQFATGETVDKAPPAIVSASPIEQSNPNYPNRNVNLHPVILINFSESLAAWSVNQDNVKIRQVVGVNPSQPDQSGTVSSEYFSTDDYTVEVASDGKGIELSFINIDVLEPFSWYQIEVSGVRDLCNNVMVGSKFWRWQTNDTLPGVRTIYPKNGYQQACPNTSVFITFNTSMYQPANDSCDVLSEGGGFVTDGALAPEVSGRHLRVVDDYPGPPADPNEYCKQYEFVPSTVGLTVETNYKVGVNTSLIFDQQGNKLNYGSLPLAKEPSQGDWGFHVAPADSCANAPVITRIVPEYGTDGQCVTIFGRYFDKDNNGQGSNDKLTFNNTDVIVSTGAWKDNTVITSVPSPSGLTKDKKYPFKIKVDFGGKIGVLDSNEYDFRLITGNPAQGPCLLSLNPNDGCFGNSVTARGTRFNTGVSGEVPKIIFNVAQFGLVESWTDADIKTKVPASSRDGDVYVMNSKGMSNPLYFDVNCGEGTECYNNIAWCPLGNYACQSGYECKTAGTKCQCTKTTVGNEELTIIENNQCVLGVGGSVTTYPSPNPYPNANQACLNSMISARFNKKILPASLSLKVEKCSGAAANPCQDQNNRQAISGNLRVLDFNENSSFFQFTPISQLTAGEFYMVTISAATGADNSRLKKSYSWIFETYNNVSQGVCPIKAVLTTPQRVKKKINETENFLATPVSENCFELVANNVVWSWLSSQPENVSVSGSKTNAETATALKNGTAYIYANTADNKKGKSFVIVSAADTPQILACDSDILTEQCDANDSLCTNLNEPVCDVEECVCTPSPEPVTDLKILNFSPGSNAQLICSNISASILFDQLIDKKSLTSTVGEPTTTQNNIRLLQNSAEVPVDLRLTIVFNGYLGCSNQTGCTEVKIYPRGALENNKTYRIDVVSGNNGLRSDKGGFLAGNQVHYSDFSVSGSARVCALSKVEISPAVYNFTQTNQPVHFVANAKSVDGNFLNPLPAVYSWVWSWYEIDKSDILSLENGESTNIKIAQAKNKNGNATLVAKAKIQTDVINHTERNEYLGYAEITNNLCLNPWPTNGQPYRDTNNSANFSLFYCRDNGLTNKFCMGGSRDKQECASDTDCGSGYLCVDADDLPGLKNPQTVTPASGTLREYLLLRNDESTDAIGLRIFSNPKHLSPQAWYAAQNFEKGSPQTLNVDGYEAIKDGRSVYVSASTLSVANNKLYTNIYLISYNQNASDQTVEVLNRLLKNWIFNTNLTNLRVCTDNTTVCNKDADCPSGGTCLADKTKLTRDTKRITDLGVLSSMIQSVAVSTGGGSGGGSGNLFTNGGFEQGLTNWSYCHGGETGHVTQEELQRDLIINSDAHSGNKSVKIAGDVHMIEPVLSCDSPVDVIPNNTYTLSVWVKENDSGFLRLDLYGVTASGNIYELTYPYVQDPLNNATIIFSSDGLGNYSNEWKKITKIFKMPSNVLKVYLNVFIHRIYAKTYQDMYIDDIALEPYSGPLTETTYKYPKLEAGTYEVGHTISKWPSWQDTLGALFRGVEINTDPLNTFKLPCASINNDKYDQQTCWNQENRIFSCPDGSYLYQYYTRNNATNYDIYANMEYENASWDNSGMSYTWSKNNSCQDFKISK